MLFQKLLVLEYQRAVLYRGGRLVGVLQPGMHGVWWCWRRETVALVDMRSQSQPLVGQEMLTRDHIPVRLTLAAVYQVEDPVAALHRVQAWQAQLYLDLQLALSELVVALSFEEVLNQKSNLGQNVQDVVKPQAAEYGILLQRVAVRDMTMPASIRDMMLKTIEAEKSAQASLIKAREEVAAARSRANAAKMLTENPGAMRLKELETFAEIARCSGNTLIFNLNPDNNGLPPTVPRAARGNGDKPATT